MPSGPDHRQTARALLAALSSMGRGDEASRIRQSFEERRWALSAADVAGLIARLHAPVQQELPIHGAADPTPTDASTPADGALCGEPDGEPVPQFVQLYRPFVQALPAWRELLEATNNLLLARGWSDLREAASELFCDVLGFDADPVTLTQRLGRRSAIQDFEQIGSFAGFRVCLVRLTRSLSDTKWSNTSEHYRPCFRLVPRALIISYEPGAGAIRLVYRQRHGQSDSRPRYRCVVGPWYLRDSQENLLTICRRLDLCRPELDDDPESLERRLQAALECEAGALAKEWVSGSIAPSGELAGVPFGRATGQLMGAFLDAGEWCWGLRAHLSNLFPIPIMQGELWLDLDGYDLMGEPLPAGACWKAARTRAQRLTLRLVLRSWDSLEVAERFEVDTELVVPDDQGWFWVEGRAYRHVPEVGPEGRILSRHTMPSWVDQLDEEEDEENQADDGRYPLSAAEGAVVDALLGRALERRLWLLMRYIRRKARESGSPGQIRAWLLASVPPGQALQLLTPAVVRALLTPVDLARPTPDPMDVASAPDCIVSAPPAWACPDLSSALAPDAWGVVAGARVHPTGALAVPMDVGGQLRLASTGESAFAVNPRLGAPAPRGPKTWWIHPNLAAHAELGVGDLESPGLLAVAGTRLDVDVVVSPDVLQPQLAPWLRPALPVMRTTLDVPKRGDVDLAPDLLVEEGQVVEAGGTWLRVPKRHLAHEIDDRDSALGNVLADVLGNTVHGGQVVRLPWDVPVRILARGLEEVTQLGTTMGWRAWVEVKAEVQGWQVVASDGQSMALEASWVPEDLPFTPEGHGFEAALPGIGGNTLCFSGMDGEPLVVEVRRGLNVAPTQPGAREGAAIGAVDRLPRPGVRSMGERWSYSRLRGLAEGASEALVAALEAGSLHRDLLLWCASLGGPPQDAPVEDVSEVPISSRPQWVRKVLSDVVWKARCGCGLLGGGALLGARCGSCGARVAPVEVAQVLRRVVLPVPVLHPWMKQTAAALLGLVVDELNVLVTRHGPAPVIAACEEALSDPGRFGRRRLALPKGHPRYLHGQLRRGLGQLVELLEAAEGPRLAPKLSLDHVGVPTLDLVKVGNTLDEVDPTGSRLMASFARLHGACWMVRKALRMNIQPLTVTARVQLQHCVDQLLGASDAEGPGTIAGLLRVVSPWSRDARPPVQRARGPHARLPASAVWWDQRAARFRLIEHHAMDLVGLVSCLPTLSNAEQRAAVRALSRDLLDEHRDPRGLLELLEGDRNRSTLPLPTAWAETRDALAVRLDASLGDVALHAVVVLLGGWWMGESSASAPSGAVWLPPGEPGPDGFRRRLPPLGHVLWRTWMGPQALRPELGLLPFYSLQMPNLQVDVVEDEQQAPRHEEVRVEVSAEIAPPLTPEVRVPPDVAPPPPAPGLLVLDSDGAAALDVADVRVIDHTVSRWLEEA